MPMSQGSNHSFVWSNPEGIYKKEAKADAKFFNQLTDCAGSSNEDKCDAGLLALFS